MVTIKKKCLKNLQPKYIELVHIHHITLYIRVKPLLKFQHQIYLLTNFSFIIPYNKCSLVKTNKFCVPPDSPPPQ